MHYSYLVRRYSAVLLALSLVGVTPMVQAERGKLESAREYLSDPPRVGSLAGTILGGALTAHPAGVVVGSVIGFFVGKQSMFKQSADSDEQYASRTIIPAHFDSSEAPQVLAFSSEVETVVEEESPPLSALPPTAEFTPVDLPMSTLDVAPQAKAVSPSLLQKIAAYCYGDGSDSEKRIDPQLQAMCYYHQSAG